MVFVLQKATTKISRKNISGRGRVAQRLQLELGTGLSPARTGTLNRVYFAWLIVAKTMRSLLPSELSLPSDQWLVPYLAPRPFCAPCEFVADPEYLSAASDSAARVCVR